MNANGRLMQSLLWNSRDREIGRLTVCPGSHFATIHTPPSIRSSSMSLTRGFARPLCAAVFWLGLAIVSLNPGLEGVSNAADRPIDLIDFERADIPADQPSAWPKEIDRCVPVPRDEFLSLIGQLKSRNRRPRSASLKSAHYEATLVNDTLTGGLMTASIQRQESEPSLMELGSYSFALNDLKWQDRAAIWGSSADGRVWVLGDGRNRELLGEWSCRGRSIPDGVDFDLELPVATTSFLDLRIPRGLLVSATTAEVTLLSDVPAESTRLWRIQCGSESRCRITCVARDRIENRKPAIVVEHELLAIVREEDLRFQLILHLEAVDAPVKDISLKIPAGIEIYSAIYGTETPVRFQQSSEADTGGRLSIQLPAPLIGRDRTLRIDGIAIQKPGQPAISPQIVVENSTFAGGRHTLIVQTPLQVRSMRLNGFRQLRPPMPTTEGESFTFQDVTVGIGGFAQGHSHAGRLGTANPAPGGRHHIRFARLVIGPHHKHRRGTDQRSCA